MSWEINKVCRTCLTSNGPMASIFNEPSEKATTLCVADMLKFFTSIKLKPNDQMPDRVCLPCISEINRCYTFKIRCENSNNSLIKLLNHASENEYVIADIPTKEAEKQVENYEDKLKCDANNSAIKDHDMHFPEFEDEPDVLEQEQEAQELGQESEEKADPLRKESNAYLALSSNEIKSIELINEVKKFECLYNGRHKSYRNNLKRNKAWQKISKAVNRSEQSCKTRWRQIRDQYVKNIKTTTVSNESKKKVWYQWPLLTYVEFLNDHIQPRLIQNDCESDTTLGIENHFSSRQQFTVELVQEVEKHKCLYDKNGGNYKEHHILRGKAWKEIAEKLNVPTKLCQSRWRSLRDRYVRWSKAASDGGETEIEKQWYLSDYLQFLKEHIGGIKRSTITMEIPSDCEPIEVDVTEITYDSDSDDSLDITHFKPELE